MKFTVESWAPEYGSPLGIDELEPTDVAVDAGVELPPGAWEPVAVGREAACRLLFVDGVRRIDAWVWIAGDDDTTRPGIAASYAAGVVRCDGEARVETVGVRRGVFSAAPTLDAIRTARGDYAVCAVPGDTLEALSQEVQRRMGQLEAEVATAAGDADLVVVDGPLSRLPSLARAVGYVKTHQKSYLPAELVGVVGRLAAGERTPLFLTTTSWSRYSWYARLPSGRSAGPASAAGHPWSGVVRCEASGDLAVAEARRFADLATATLPHYASRGHKDARAPQNLYPIAELERALRHRLGEPALMYRALRTAVPTGT